MGQTPPKRVLGDVVVVSVTGNEGGVAGTSPGRETDAF